MIKETFLFILIATLSGCLPRYQSSPEYISNCQYAQLKGPIFKFAPLPAHKQYAGYVRVYTYTNRGSRNLAYTAYLGQKGKLTDAISRRDYGNHVYFGLSGTRCSAFYDCEPDSVRRDFYLTKAQRDQQSRKSGFVVRKAILENCQVVYIRIDSRSPNYLDPKLIVPAGLQLLSAKHTHTSLIVKPN